MSLNVRVRGSGDATIERVRVMYAKVCVADFGARAYARVCR